jgi:hypothetical protein
MPRLRAAGAWLQPGNVEEERRAARSQQVFISYVRKGSMPR